MLEAEMTEHLGHDKYEYTEENKGKNKSIVRFNIELSNGSIINVKAYNEIADYCYRKLKLNDEIFIQGYLDNKMELNLVYINMKF